MNNKPKDKESAPAKEKPPTAMNEYKEIANFLDSRAPPEPISLKKKDGINPDSAKPQKPPQQQKQDSHKAQEKPKSEKPSVQPSSNGKPKEEQKGEPKKKVSTASNIQKTKPTDKPTEKQTEKKQEQNVPRGVKDEKYLQEEERLAQILSKVGLKKEKKPQPKKPKDSKPGKKDSSKTNVEQAKDKKSSVTQKVQQKQSQVTKRAEPQKNKVSLIHSKLKKQDDEYDLNDSFIDNTQEEIEDSQAQREIFETLHKLRKIREKDGDMDDGDIPEDSFEEIQRQEKQSRLIGKFTDMKEEKALLAEQRKKKKK